MGEFEENLTKSVVRKAQYGYGKKMSDSHSVPDWRQAVEKTRRNNDPLAGGMTQNEEVLSGQRHNVPILPYRKEEDEEYRGKLDDEEMDEEDRGILRSLYLEEHRNLGRMPTIAEFKSFLLSKGVSADLLSYDVLQSALSTVFQSHGGSDNLTNLRTPGQPPGKVQAQPGKGGSSYVRQGRGTVYPTKPYAEGAGGYPQNFPQNLGSPTPTQSRGLTDREASRQFYDSGHKTPLSGGVDRPRQAYTTYPAPFRASKHLSPLSKYLMDNMDCPQAGTFHKSLSVKKDEEMRRMISEEFPRKEEEGEEGPYAGRPGAPNVYSDEEEDDEVRFNPREEDDEEGRSMADELLRRSEEEEEMADHYREAARHERNLSAQRALKETEKKIRLSAMQKRVRANSVRGRNSLSSRLAF